MSKGIARRTGTATTGRKTTAQISTMVGLAPMDRLQPGEVECPTCGHPAFRDARDDRGFRYFHQFRLFPCRSALVSLTDGELLHLFDPSLTSIQAHNRLKDGPGV